jgi:hypothetical protein
MIIVAVVRRATRSTIVLSVAAPTTAPALAAHAVECKSTVKTAIGESAAEAAVRPGIEPGDEPVLLRPHDSLDLATEELLPLLTLCHGEGQVVPTVPHDELQRLRHCHQRRSLAAPRPTHVTEPSAAATRAPGSRSAARPVPVALDGLHGLPREGDDLGDEATDAVDVVGGKPWRHGAREEEEAGESEPQTALDQELGHGVENGEAIAEPGTGRRERGQDGWTPLLLGGGRRAWTAWRGRRLRH